MNSRPVKNIEQLIVESFERTRLKGVGDWHRMTLSAFKSRLMNLTSGSFNENDYGAANITEFVARFPHLILLDDTTVPFSVVLRGFSELPVAIEPIESENDYDRGDATEEEAVEALSSGDLLLYGEILLNASAGADLDRRVALATSAWSSATSSTSIVASMQHLVERFHEFAPEALAKAVVRVMLTLNSRSLTVPTELKDLAYRCLTPIETIFDVSARGLEQTCAAATAKLAHERGRVVSEISLFTSTNPATAKDASVAVLRAVKTYRVMCVDREQPLLRSLETVLGSTFRKFCEAYTANDVPTLLRRIDDLRSQLNSVTPDAESSRTQSLLWRDAIGIGLSHVGALVDHALQRIDASTAPSLALAEKVVKLDLRPGSDREVICRVANTGQGRATNVTLVAAPDRSIERFEIVHPQGQFDVESRSERLITFAVRAEVQSDSVSVLLSWHCSAQSGRLFEFDDSVDLVQQAGEPAWDALVASPPYTLNPVRKREQLFGRDAVLADLLLHASSQTSTFLWGAKRVGKTSVLQVLADALSDYPGVAPVLFRMGEIGSMHEGEIASAIAGRLAEIFDIPPPREEEFGAGLRRLIPFVDRLPIHSTGPRPLVIIDEFDDLDSSFYSGERGRQFVKALRSLSEIGVTFFFVGSERMDAIYRRHASDLNKWVNIRLDKIESRDDCRALITLPVKGAIEFQSAAVEFLIDYCGGNPFYLNVICMELFKRSAQERRTYVGLTDVQTVRRQLSGRLGASNFAHFWNDNPELDSADREKQAAENALVLACIVQLGGQYETLEEIEDQQSVLAIKESQRLSRSELERAVNRLKHRAVLRPVEAGPTPHLTVGPPIFLEWISENTEELLELWRSYTRAAAAPIATEAAALIVEPSSFSIPEDDLIAVTQGLIFLGKQRDVAEVRSWLRQFDDESRIEMAFALLRRLAEKGYVSEGNQVRALTVIEEAVNQKRLEIGAKSWKMFRQKRDNLCVAHVDGETKSGAAVARELWKRMRPSKVGRVDEIAPWLKSRANEDPILVIVDDFAGTGSTLANGLSVLENTLRNAALAPYRSGRVLCYVQYAFPAAVDAVRTRYPWLEVCAVNVFSDEVRALEPEAGIFATEGERKFAKDVLLQIGRELQPQAPFGFGDIGALVSFHNTIPNNTLPVFWCSGTVNDRPWKALFQRA
jgi:hypothetical protein